MLGYIGSMDSDVMGCRAVLFLIQHRCHPQLRQAPAQPQALLELRPLPRIGARTRVSFLSSNGDIDSWGGQEAEQNYALLNKLNDLNGSGTV